MVNVWATTCGPCIQEMPHIQQLANNYAGRGLKVATVLAIPKPPGVLTPHSPLSEAFRALICPCCATTVLWPLHSLRELTPPHIS